jgi:hypothetical protein
LGIGVEARAGEDACKRFRDLATTKIAEARERSQPLSEALPIQERTGRTSIKK